MTLMELYEPIKEAIGNGDGDLQVYVREYCKSHEQTMNPVELFDRVISYSSGQAEEYCEIVYKNYSHDEKEDKPIQYTAEYTQRLADEVQSYRDKTQQIFAAWRKQNKESAEMIKDMLNLMKHKMKPCDTERCKSEFDNMRYRAEVYLKQISDINYEMIVPVEKE